MGSDAFAVELTRTTQLYRAGVTSRRLARLIDGGAFVRVRRGILVSGADWRGMRFEARTIVLARAWALAAGDPPVFSHTTAAAVQGLPLVRTGSPAVHTIVPDPRKGATPGVVRHRDGGVDRALRTVSGLIVTDLAATVADIARTSLPETAIAAADAALRGVSRDPAHPEVVRLRERALAHAAEFARGGIRARRVIEFADPRAHLPGESVSRLYLVRLGFAVPDLQVAVRGPGGTTYYVDFGLDDVEAFGEFDGESKYTDPTLLNGRTTAQALTDEKWREDWIRGSTHRRLARWGTTHIPNAQALGERLARFSIRPPVRRGGLV
ncbi:hypothetical protein M4I32_09290 [Microbacterium sp. LRZ72]|uniref:hypothetical protein n=1 Tax=Microbacterium sp. LRZ72 TaxID=2942481 RepID=UPI0029ACE89B|nr:hypothetical protein [Microbacterium sp. LRZ72]MDX2376990.1 hypothetical protein [Microbacterium sp. LRZ72]